MGLHDKNSKRNFLIGILTIVIAGSLGRVYFSDSSEDVSFLFGISVVIGLVSIILGFCAIWWDRKEGGRHE